MSDDTRRPARDKYADCGAAMRRALDTATAADVGALDRRVLDAVLYFTASYSKLADMVGARQLAAQVYGVKHDDVTGWQRHRVTKGLRRLRDLGVIDYEAGRGRYGRSRLSLPMVARTTPIEGQAEDSMGAPPVVNRGSSSNSIGAPARATPRSSSEKSSPSARASQELVQIAARKVGMEIEEPDPLKERCIAHYSKFGVTHDDCRRVIDELRSAGYDDLRIIDVALGQCENAKGGGARHLNYLRRVAADFYRQRVGAVA